MGSTKPRKLKVNVHKDYHTIIKEYPFQPVMNDQGKYVNIILVRSPFQLPHQELFDEYKDQILFLGMCSFEDYPLRPANPYSPKFPADKYVGMFPGFLHMFREPEKIFPAHVKLLLMSQSDFALPNPEIALARTGVAKKYDFTFSGSDQDAELSRLVISRKELDLCQTSSACHVW